MTAWEQDGLWSDGGNPGDDEPAGGVPSEKPEVDFDLDAWEEDHSTAAGDEAITPQEGRQGFDAGDPSTWRSGRTLGDLVNFSALSVMPNYARMFDHMVGFQRQSLAALVTPALTQIKPQVPAWRSVAERMIEDRSRIVRRSTESAVTAFLPQQRTAIDTVLAGIKPVVGAFDTAAFKTGITIDTGFESVSRQMFRQIERLVQPALGDMSALRVPALAHMAANVTGLGLGMEEVLRNFAATMPPIDPGAFALQGVSALLRNVPPGASVLNGDLPLDLRTDDAEPTSDLLWTPARERGKYREAIASVLPLLREIGRLNPALARELALMSVPPVFIYLVYVRYVHPDAWDLLQTLMAAGGITGSIVTALYAVLASKKGRT